MPKKEIVIFGDADIAWIYQQHPVDSRGGSRTLSLNKWSGSAVLGGAGTLTSQVKLLAGRATALKPRSVIPDMADLPRLERDGKLPTVSMQAAHVPQKRGKDEKKVYRVGQFMGWAPAGSHSEYIDQLKTWISDAAARVAAAGKKGVTSAKDKVEPKSLGDKDSVFLMNDSGLGFTYSYLTETAEKRGNGIREHLKSSYSDLGLQDDAWLVVKARIVPPLNYELDVSVRNVTLDFSAIPDNSAEAKGKKKELQRMAEALLPSDAQTEGIAKPTLEQLAACRRAQCLSRPASRDDWLLLCLSASDLRAAGIHISKGISWERTIQHIAERAQPETPFEDGLCIPGLAKARFVLIQLGAEAIAFLDNQQNNLRILFAHKPAQIEGDSAKVLEGEGYATHSWAASVIATYLALAPVAPKDLFDELAKDSLLPALLAMQNGLLRDGLVNTTQGTGEQLAFGGGVKFGGDGDWPSWNLTGNEYVKTAEGFEKWTDRGTTWGKLSLEGNYRQFQLKWDELDIPERRKKSTDRRTAMGDAAPEADDFQDTWWTLLTELLRTTTYEKWKGKSLEERFFRYARLVLEYGGRNKDEFFPDLLSCPYARFGNLVTSDRREIESLRNFASVIEEHVARGINKPLNLAVFGPPGAGKSFGVTQLLESLELGKKKRFLTFNLSQFSSADALPSCFQIVQSVVLDGDLPVVFWDEFDTTLQGVPFGWLHAFLAPMQDGKFVYENRENPLGACIFVFAGSRFSSFRDLPSPEHPVERPRDEVVSMSWTEAEERSRDGIRQSVTKQELDRIERANLLRRQENWRQAKGHDFRSRLRAFLDVQDPNPVRVLQPGTEDYVPFDAKDPLTCDQLNFLVRRARMLRSWLYKDYHSLFAKEEWEEKEYDLLKIHETNLRGFLTPHSFRHGSRSIESIVAASRLLGQASYSNSAIPPASVVGIHVNPAAFEAGGKSFPDREVEELREVLVPKSSIKDFRLTVTGSLHADGYIEMTWNNNGLINVEGLEFLVGPESADEAFLYPIRVKDASSPLSVSLNWSQEARLGIPAAGTTKLKIAVRAYRGADRSVLFTSWTADYGSGKFSNLAQT